MSDVALTEPERYALAASGDHGPETCDCDAYAPENGYPDDLICEGLAFTFAGAERILAARVATAEREAAARFRAAAELTVQDVRAQRGDHIASLVEDSFAAHFARAAALHAEVVDSHEWLGMDR